jgi:hypothetical protein
MRSKLRLTLAVIVLASVMGFLTLYGAFSGHSVHACHDKENNPPDIQKLCKELTQNQWWGAYYEGKQK